MKVFVLAGGFATRLWPLTEKRAKPLLPLAGVPIISHPINDLPDDLAITVSTNKIFEDGFHEWKNMQNHHNVEILIEETKSDDQKLGALGAIAQWVQDHNIDDDVLLLTGDNYFGFKLPHFLETYQEGTPLLAAYDIGKKELAKAFGTVIVEGNQIVDFEEKPKEPKSTLVSTGCSILPKATLPLLVKFAKHQPDNVGGIFEELLRNDVHIHCYSFSDPWFDIGSFQAYLDATKKLVGQQVLEAPGASRDNTKCNGSVVIGKNSKVTNSELSNVVIFEDCNIDDCILENCIIDNNTVLKSIDLTGKMLRENTELIKK